MDQASSHELWHKLLDWPNLQLAALKARRRKRSRPAVVRFEFRREWELLGIQRELASEGWRPGPFVTHWINKPKPRLISAAPYRDRVVHHAVMNVLEPILERRFHPNSFACRIGKGTHAAARMLQRLLRRYRYSLQFDVRKYFPSIDHETLKGKFRNCIADGPILRLLDRIVDGSNRQEFVPEWFPGDNLFTPATRPKGLPIGNLTSQWFANWFLDSLDQRVTRWWMVSGYVRYCDDFILLDDNAGKLREMAQAVPEYLAGLRLRVHEERLSVLRSKAGRVFVGFRIFPTHRVIKAANRRGFIRRLRWMRRALRDGRISSDMVHQRIMSWLGHAGQANCRRLIRRLARDWILVDGEFARFRE